MDWMKRCTKEQSAVATVSIYMSRCRQYRVRLSEFFGPKGYTIVGKGKKARKVLRTYDDVIAAQVLLPGGHWETISNHKLIDKAKEACEKHSARLVRNP